MKTKQINPLYFPGGMPSETQNRFLLLFGSQTGQAKAIAEEIQDKSEQFGLHAELHCISQTEKKVCNSFVSNSTQKGIQRLPSC